MFADLTLNASSWSGSHVLRISASSSDSVKIYGVASALTTSGIVLDEIAGTDEARQDGEASQLEQERGQQTDR